tara:strand:- start:2460 stop:2663 length:204 start_codon:yes stop_codon:yes gene_type:complete
MEEEEKTRVRPYIVAFGIAIFLSILCFGCRQLALLEERIATQTRYEVLEQELVELTEEGLDEFFTED